MDAPEVISGPERSLSHMLRRQPRLQIPPPVHSPVAGNEESMYEFHIRTSSEDEKGSFNFKTPTRSQSTILGFRRKRVILGLSMVILVLVATIGGGFGGSLVASNARRASDSSPMIVMMPTTITMTPTNGTPGPTPKSTPTSTAEVTSEITPEATPKVTPKVNPQVQTTTTADATIKVPTQGVIDFDCGRASMNRQIVTLGGFSWGFDVNCMMDYIGPGVNLAGMTVYSFGDCIGACAMFNNFARNNTCLGVFFNANLTTSLPMFNGNCFLKAYLPQMSPEMDIAAAASLASAPTF